MGETHPALGERKTVIKYRKSGNMGMYIINVANTVDRIIYVHVVNGATLICSEPVCELTPYTAYTEPDDEALKAEIYQKGLADAWKCAKKLLEEVMDWRFRNEFMVDMFQCEDAGSVMCHYTASEAIARLKKYEHEQEELMIKTEDKKGKKRP